MSDGAPANGDEPPDDIVIRLPAVRVASERFERAEVEVIAQEAAEVIEVLRQLVGLWDDARADGAKPEDLT